MNTDQKNTVDLGKFQSTSWCCQADKGLATQYQCAVSNWGLLEVQLIITVNELVLQLGHFNFSNPCALNMTEFGSGVRFCV